MPLLTLAFTTPFLGEIAGLGDGFCSMTGESVVMAAEDEDEKSLNAATEEAVNRIVGMNFEVIGFMNCNG